MLKIASIGNSHQSMSWWTPPSKVSASAIHSSQNISNVASRLYNIRIKSIVSLDYLWCIESVLVTEPDLVFSWRDWQLLDLKERLSTISTLREYKIFPISKFLPRCFILNSRSIKRSSPSTFGLAPNLAPAKPVQLLRTHLQPTRIGVMMLCRSATRPSFGAHAYPIQRTTRSQNCLFMYDNSIEHVVIWDRCSACYNHGV